ncbi:hypothetical protein JCM12141A_61290 [Mycolicibacterium hodleri]
MRAGGGLRKWNDQIGVGSFGVRRVGKYPRLINERIESTGGGKRVTRGTA